MILKNMHSKVVIKTIILSASIALADFAYAQNTLGDIQVDSPLDPGITDLPSLVLAILNVFITLSIPVIVIAIVYAGFLYVTARGNPQTIKTATKALTYAVIGAVLIIGALVITEVIGDTIVSFGATG